MKALIENCFRWLNTGASGLQSPFLLLVRLYWGWQFIGTGWGKVNNIGKVTEFFTTLGIPLPGLNAHFVAGLELVGGILLVLGLAARPIGFLLSINMLVAYITADREALLSFITDPDKFTAAAPFTFLMGSLIVLIFGAGCFSVDSWIAWRRRPKTESAIGAQPAIVWDSSHTGIFGTQCPAMDYPGFSSLLDSSHSRRQLLLGCSKRK